MKVAENFNLKSYNTFGINVVARYFASFRNIMELKEVLSRQLPAPLVLGGGSNLLFTKNYDGLVLKNEMKGIYIVREDEDYTYVRAGAGENWHGLVMHCINLGLGGLENLSLIPGNVGASPMQNIGAYGVELKDVFDSLEALHLHDQYLVRFNAATCAFGYRDSIFKRQTRNEYAITAVTFRLSKKPVLNTSYGAIEEELAKMGVEPSIRSVSEAVIRIRSSKLPDPRQIGNAGSFFKNPIVSAERGMELKEKYPALPIYPHDEGQVKLAAGWLIEQCGWKGYREGDAGCHSRQALVLVNYGEASGKDIYALSERIVDSVRVKFGITLEKEVNIN